MAGAQENQASTQSTESTKKIVEVPEEDDLFEEFEVEDWDLKQQVTDDLTQWQHDWDDDDVEDDFTKQLRRELSATKE